MKQALCMLAWLVMSYASLAAPAPRPWVNGWDKPTDPDGDCTFRRDHDTLTIEVPAREHELNAYFRRMNAPRLLRDVSGDFEAQGPVSGDFFPRGAHDGQTLHIHAGLVLMADDDDYLRLQWRGSSDANNKEGRAYVDWERHKDKEAPECHIGVPGTQAVERVAAYLRLQRRGDKVFCSFSEDGEMWRELRSPDAKFPTKLKVGVFAATDSAAPFKPRFDRFQLTVKGTKRGQ